jgi:hypothetical protein
MFRRLRRFIGDPATSRALLAWRRPQGPRASAFAALRRRFWPSLNGAVETSARAERRSIAFQENLPIINAGQSAAQSEIEYLLQKSSILEFSVWSGPEARQNPQILVET